MKFTRIFLNIIYFTKIIKTNELLHSDFAIIIRLFII